MRNIERRCLFPGQTQSGVAAAAAAASAGAAEAPAPREPTAARCQPDRSRRTRRTRRTRRSRSCCWRTASGCAMLAAAAAGGPAAQSGSRWR